MELDSDGLAPEEPPSYCIALLTCPIVAAGCAALRSPPWRRPEHGEDFARRPHLLRAAVWLSLEADGPVRVCAVTHWYIAEPKVVQEESTSKVDRLDWNSKVYRQRLTLEEVSVGSRSKVLI
eukprot:4923730-Pleurochrysis_carterae.AAC.9